MERRGIRNWRFDLHPCSAERVRRSARFVPSISSEVRPHILSKVGGEVQRKAAVTQSTGTILAVSHDARTTLAAASHTAFFASWRGCGFDSAAAPSVDVKYSSVRTPSLLVCVLGTCDSWVSQCFHAGGASSDGQTGKEHHRRTRMVRLRLDTGG